MNAGVRQLRAGFYGTVTHEDRHVSQPYPDEYWHLAEILADAEHAARGVLLESLPDDYDRELLDHLVHLVNVRNHVQRLKTTSNT